ncbi:hypothetical protein GII34_23110 [Gordonia amarae]|nr:hypothetical protein GII34_23110 [Gordonia amarae]
MRRGIDDGDGRRPFRLRGWGWSRAGPPACCGAAGEADPSGRPAVLSVLLDSCVSGSVLSGSGPVGSGVLRSRVLRGPGFGRGAGASPEPPFGVPADSVAAASAVAPLVRSGPAWSAGRRPRRLPRRERRDLRPAGASPRGSPAACPPS